MICCPQLRLLQTFFHHRGISRNQLDLKFPRNSHECSLELVVLDVVRIRRLCLASYDLVGGEDTDERSVEKTLSDNLARAGACTSAETEVVQTRCGFLGGWVKGRQPALRIEFAGIRAEVIYIFGVLSGTRFKK